MILPVLQSVEKMSSSANNMLAQYYNSISPVELKDVIVNEFTELFDLTDEDWRVRIAKDSPPPDLLAFRKILLIRALHIINSFIAKYEEGAAAQDSDVSKILKAIDTIFLTFEESLLQQAGKRRYIYIIKFVLQKKPTLLRLMVDRLPTWFYQADDNTEFTRITLDYLNLLTEQEVCTALPLVYQLFVNPTNANPSGLYNKTYSEFTQHYLRTHVSGWFDILPNIWT